MTEPWVTPVPNAKSEPAIKANDVGTRVMGYLHS